MTVSRSPARKKSKTKPEPCPKCGQIECFKRTRYFPGQLLTNHDLETDQRYFIEKNKLHNRHLVGSGVVCGLAVRCGKCDGTITVEPGYAIDCCGNDIVLCDAAEFDVLEYLEACRRAVEPDCYSKIPPRRSRCEDEPQEYCLILSFTETFADPVTAFTRQHGCTPNRCEPSRICEGYRIDLVKKDELEEQSSSINMWDKIQDCFASLSERFTAFGNEFEAAQVSLNDQEFQSYHATVFNLFCRMVAYIKELYKKHPKVRCTLLEELREVEASFPDRPNSLIDPSSGISDQLGQYERQVNQAVASLFILIFQFWIDCLCDALLVPCQECKEEGVLLACLTLCGNKIQKICNIVRKPVLTGPALQYWLQPIYDAVGDLLGRLCCEFELRLPDQRERGVSDQPPYRTVARVSDQPSYYGATRMPVQRRDPQDVKAKFDRSAALFKLARDIPATSIANLSNLTLSQIRQPANTITAVELYNQPAASVRRNLDSHNIRFVERQAATTAEAYDLRMLTRMSWDAIPDGAEVELITSPEGLVTGIRRVGGPES